MTDSKTATERLRELLDERGVEWRDSEPYGANAVTKFDVRGITLRYVEYPDYCWLDYHENEALTPEQAIAATLGSDRDKVYDAGFTNGIKATLQQLDGLLMQTDSAVEIQAWVDRQWEEEVV